MAGGLVRGLFHDAINSGKKEYCKRETKKKFASCEEHIYTNDDEGAKMSLVNIIPNKARENFKSER